MARLTTLSLVMGLPMRNYGAFTAKEQAIISSRGAIRVIHNACTPAVIVRTERVARVVQLAIVPKVVKGL